MKKYVELDFEELLGALSSASITKLNSMNKFRIKEEKKALIASEKYGLISGDSLEYNLESYISGEYSEDFSSMIRDKINKENGFMTSKENHDFLDVINFEIIKIEKQIKMLKKGKAIFTLGNKSLIELRRNAKLRVLSNNLEVLNRSKGPLENQYFITPANAKELKSLEKRIKMFLYIGSRSQSGVQKEFVFEGRKYNMSQKYINVIRYLNGQAMALRGFNDLKEEVRLVANDDSSSVLNEQSSLNRLGVKYIVTGGTVKSFDLFNTKVGKAEINPVVEPSVEPVDDTVKPKKKKVAKEKKKNSNPDYLEYVMEPNISVNNVVNGNKYLMDFTKEDLERFRSTEAVDKKSKFVFNKFITSVNNGDSFKKNDKVKEVKVKGKRLIEKKKIDKKALVLSALALSASLSWMCSRSSKGSDLSNGEVVYSSSSNADDSLTVSPDVESNNTVPDVFDIPVVDELVPESDVNVDELVPESDVNVDELENNFELGDMVDLDVTSPVFSTVVDAVDYENGYARYYKNDDLRCVEAIVYKYPTEPGHVIVRIDDPDHENIIKNYDELGYVRVAVLTNVVQNDLNEFEGYTNINDIEGVKRK